MNKMKKIVSILIIVIIIISSTPIAYAGPEEDLKKQEQELKKIQDKLNKLEKEKNNAKKSENKIINSINSIEKNIKGIESEISKLISNISETEQSILEITSNLQDTNGKIEKKNDLLNNRLRTMYKAGNVAYLEVLLGASDFSDFLTRIDMVQEIYKHDIALIEELKAQKTTIESDKKMLEEEKARLQQLSNEVVGKQTQLNSSLVNLQGKKSEIRQDLKALEELEDELLEDANKVTEIIKNLNLMVTYVGGKMTWPLPGKTRISSPFGYRIHPVYKTKKLHSGVDIPAAYGTKVLAAQSGTVIYSDWFGGYGKAVMIDHGGGYVSLYAHNSKLMVKVGQKVERGQAVAQVGSTGVSTGNHLHFEIRENGEYVDPMKWTTPY